MKKALFLDRDGTLIYEPPSDYQIDTLEKLEFMPGVFRNLYHIRKNLSMEMVIVSNQDGLGTDTYPEDAWELVQGKMLTCFRNEDITFDDIVIDTSLPEEHKPTRKPGTELLTKYLKGDYNLPESYVIGDRLTDLELAKNLGCKGILYASYARISEVENTGLQDVCVLISNDWDEIYAYLSNKGRTVSVTRNTRETKINIELSLDGEGKTSISTGLGFFDHMLDQLGRHSGCDLSVTVQGDLHVDEHHTIEDTAIALGDAFNQALANKAGVERYGFLLPMDDSLARVAIDFGGRPWLVWDVEFKREKVGDVPTEMFYHFFKSFCDAARCNANISVQGDNEHHKIEAVFKAFAKSIKMAVRKDIYNQQLPTTKGML
jgi:imidazoleglycerol-phosphate dehydratase/histidinol-phosphatase